MSSRLAFKGKKQALILLTPAILLFASWVYVPGVDTLRRSLFIDRAFGFDVEFVGLSQYVELLTSNTYQMSIFVTIIFALVVAVGTLFFALLITYQIYIVTRGKSIYMILAIWPYALPPAVAGSLIMFYSHPSVGILPFYLHEWFGIDLFWRQSGVQAFSVVSVAAIWKQLGYNVIFLIAAFHGVPKRLGEVAEIDGVGHMKMLFKVYVPLLSPTIIFLLVMNTIYAFFRTFPIIDLTTDGGPGNATNIMIYQLYRDGFVHFNWGSAAAQSIILFVFVVIVMVIQFKASEKYAHY